MILDRTLARAYLGSFCFALGFFSLALLAADLFFGGGRALLEHNEIASLFRYTALRTLPALDFAFPMATLLATLLVVGRYSSTHELLAIRCGGVSFTRFLCPILAINSLLVFASLIAHLVLIPSCVRLADQTLTQALGDGQILAGLSLPTQVLGDGQEMTMAARSFKPATGEFSGLSINFFWEGRRTREIYIQEGAWLGDAWKLERVQIDAAGPPESTQRFSTLETRSLSGLDLPSPADFENMSRLPEELSAPVLLQQIRSTQGEKKRKLRLHLAQRFAIPFASLIFTILCAPLAAQQQRSGLSAGLGTSLAVCGLYYVCAVVGGAAVHSCHLYPLVGAWMPNLVFLALGLRQWIKHEQT